MYFIVQFITVLAVGWFLTTRQWLTVPDVNKAGNVRVSRLGGVAILSGIIISWFFTPEFWPVIASAGIAFGVGFIDDLRVMRGWYKPAAMLLPVIPLIFLDYDIFYLLLAAAYVTGMSNATNSVDVLNGAVSGIMVVTFVTLAIILLIGENYEVMNFAIIMGGVSVAFYLLHRYPSRLFPGDSGSLVLGTSFAVICIMGGVPILGGIMMAPAILNIALYVRSHGFSEHRAVSSKSVISRPDRMLERSIGPATLVSLILNKPRSEQDIVTRLMLLTVTSCAAAVLISYVVMI